ncbi:hypothetical protein Scep_009751 [Stephania cephalantha]|uniref:Uncharacterized protein n=1 Tax=Stephania cephalantha TaxID=152367 RepID=A0AAP0JW11_9MAGN
MTEWVSTPSKRGSDIIIATAEQRKEAALPPLPQKGSSYEGPKEKARGVVALGPPP